MVSFLEISSGNRPTEQRGGRLHKKSHGRHPNQYKEMTNDNRGKATIRGGCLNVTLTHPLTGIKPSQDQMQCLILYS